MSSTAPPARPPCALRVERDVREARKLRVRMALASQRLEDFGGALAELANRYWILGAGGKTREIETLSEMFQLSETVAEAIRYRLTGPGPDGAPALLIASDTRGRFEQLVVNTPGPIELWALTTSPADVALRNRLYARLSPADARASLARAFPTGSARAWDRHRIEAPRCAWRGTRRHGRRRARPARRKNDPDGRTRNNRLRDGQRHTGRGDLET